MQQRRTPAGPGGRAGRPGGRDTAARARPTRGGGATRATGGARTPGTTTGLGRPAARPDAPARPVAARRSSASGAAKRTPAPQPRRFTGRATVLATVLVALLLAYAYPVRVYLAQQAQIAQLEQDQADQRARITSMTEQRQMWNDPEYVKLQARRRLNYGLPGETLFQVVDPAAAQHQPGAAPDKDANRSWYGDLWHSIRVADKPPAP